MLDVAVLVALLVNSYYQWLTWQQKKMQPQWNLLCAVLNILSFLLILDGHEFAYYVALAAAIASYARSKVALKYMREKLLNNPKKK